MNALLAAFLLLASTPGPAIVFDHPTDNADIGVAATNVTLRWHIERKACPSWGVEVWCVTDNERIFSGTVAAPSNRPSVTVSGLKPNRIYYAKVIRNWVRAQECVFTTGTVPAPKAASLPASFCDTSRYEVVEMPRGEACDLARTRFRGFTRGVYLDRKSPTAFLVRVPCRPYAKAYVLCKVDPDPKKDPCFNLRLTRYVTRPWNKMRGRAREAMCDTRVDLRNGASGGCRCRKEGEFVLCEVPLDMGNIQDLLYHDREGDFPGSNDLDLELMGRTPAGRSGFSDNGADTDFRFTSAVTVYALALEKSPAALETKCIQPGNIFANDEKPEGLACVRLERPGAYELSVEATDADGRVVGVTRRRVTDDGEYRLAFPISDLGWYGLVWRLAGPDGVTLSSTASAAVLGPDTRTTEMGEQYGTWTWLGPWGSHGYPKSDDPTAVDYMSTILAKAGFRLTTIQQPPANETERMKHYKGVKNTLSDDECRKYKLGAPNTVSYPRDWENYYKRGGESNFIAVIRARLKRNPHCKIAKLFHESASMGTVAPEALGFEPNEKEKKASAEKAKGAIEFCRFLRKHFPEIRIVVGNSGSTSEFIAELIRHGLTEDLVDDMGMEVVGNETLPEYPTAGGLEGAEHFRALAAHYGYKWGIDQCFESNYRQDLVLGAEEQASFYVRDILLAHVWGFPSIWVGVEADFANHYNFSQWGNTGLCSRYPFVYPKKSYVAVATATRLLDRVTGVKKIPTGDECVYAVEFARADGQAVTAFWTSRGEVTLEVETGFWNRLLGGVEAYDLYGRPLDFDGTLVASKRVTYLVGEPGLVRGVSVVKRSFPDDAKPTDYRAVATCDDAAAWEVAKGPLGPKGPEHDFGTRHSWPHRTFAPATFCAVDDPEMGHCLELEISDDGKSVSPMHYRYNALMLKKPIRIGRPFASIGATVKGNSGWGEVYYILEDSKGRRTYSCETGQQGMMDRTCRSVIDFTGWNFLRMFVNRNSSVRELKCDHPKWIWTDPSVADDPEVKLVGLVFAARLQPLYLNETKPCRQVLRVKDIGVFD